MVRIGSVASETVSVKLGGGGRGFGCRVLADV